LAEREAARLKLERNLGFLGTLGSNAPFVGLLGTVIGIVRSFQRLGESAGQVSAGLMAEVGEALVATAIGILVALPAIAFFNLFHRSIKSRLGHAEVLGRDVLAYLKSTASQLEASRRATLSAE
jgi:biopolymer transport protein ExbB